MRSTLSTSFGRWQQRRGLSLSVLQQLVSLESYRWCSGSRQPWGEVVSARSTYREISVTTRWTSGQCVAWPPCRPWLTTVHSSHAVIKSASSTVVYTADSVFRTAIGGFSNFDRRRCGSLQACWSSAVVGPTITRPAYRAAAAVDRYLLPAPDLSSKPAGCRCCCRSTALTDGRKGTRPFYGAYCTLCGPRNKYCGV